MTDRYIEVRLVNNHPAASRREVARFKNVKKPEAIKLLAASQVTLFGTTSMWQCQLRTESGWQPFGKQGQAQVKAEYDRLTKLWHPMDEWRRGTGS